MPLASESAGMAKDTFSYEDLTKPAQKPASTKDTFSYEEISGKTPARGFGGWARDIAATAVKGAIAVPEAVVGLADIPTGGAVGKFLENEDGALGFRPKQAKEFVNEWHSDATKEAQRKFQEADGLGGKLQSAIENPSVIATAVGESIPSMLAGGVAARGLMAARGAMAANAATRAGLGEVAAAKAAEQAASKFAPLAGAAGEGVTGAGAAAEQIRQETPDGLLTPEQAALAGATGLATTAFGAAGGKLATKLGIGDAETMLAQGAKGIGAEAAQQSALKSIPKQVVQGAMAEGLLEELPQSVSEQILQNLALDKDWTDGVDTAAVLGVLSGGAMGGGAAGLNGVMSRGVRKPEQPVQDQKQESPDQNTPTSGIDRIRKEYEARLSELFQQEAGEPQVAQSTPPDGRAILNAQEAAAKYARDAEMAANRAVQSPDDEIFQSTGATVPRSVQMGLNPSAGPMSAAAAAAVDTGAADRVQEQAAMAQAAKASEKIPASDLFDRKDAGKRVAHRVTGTMDGRPLTTMVMASSPEDAMATVAKSSPGMVPVSAAPVTEPATPTATTGETTNGTAPTQSVQSQPQEAQAAAELGQPLTDTGTNMLGRGADPLQSIIQSQADASRAAVKPPRGILAKKAAADAKRKKANEQAAEPAAATPESAAAPAPAVRGTGVSGGDQPQPLDALSNVQDQPQGTNVGGAAAKPVNREQAIRDAWRKEPRTIGKWTPISVEAEGQKADMLVNQKRAGGDKDGALHVVNIRMGKMLKDMEREPIAYTFRLTADNRLVEEGIPTVATPGQIAAWKGAGFALDDKQANVQDAPQGTEDQAAAAPVEAPAPAGGNAASNAGVPDTRAGEGVRKDGVGKKQVFNIGGRDPHTATFEHKDDGRLIRTITYPDGQASTETLVTNRNGDESWVSQSSYEKGEFYPVQLSEAEAGTAIRDDIAGKPVKPAAPGATDVQADGVTSSVDSIAQAINASIADGAIKNNKKLYAERIAKGHLTQEEADRRAAADAKTWSEQKPNERTLKLAKAIADKDPTVLVGAWAKEGQGTYGNEGSMEAFRKLTGINLKRMNSADRAKAIFDWAGWSEDQVRADVEKRKAAKAEADAAYEAKEAARIAEWNEKQAEKTPLRVKGKDGETTVKAYVDDLIKQGYTDIGQTKKGAVKQVLLFNPKTNSGYPMPKGILADYAKQAVEKVKASKEQPSTDVQADGVNPETVKESLTVEKQPRGVLAKMADQKAKATQEFTAADAQAAERQLAQMIGDRIDGMQAQIVQKIGAKFLPTMGIKAPIGKAKIKAAVTDFTKVNPLAAASEFGVEMADSLRAPLIAQFEGRLVDATKPAAPAQQEAKQAADDKPKNSGSIELFNQRRGQDAPAEEAEAVQSAIEGKSLIEAAQFVADTGTDAQREVAGMVVKKLQAMQEAGVNLELKVAHRGDQVPQDLIFSRGYTEIGMDAKGRDVVVWLNGADVKSKVGTDYETLLHELVHAATAGAMRHAAFVKDSPYGDALKSLDSAAQAISDHITSRFEQADAGDIELTEFEKDIRAQANNAFTNLDEVVSWALTSREAQEYLDGIPYKSGSLWTRFVRAVRSALGLPADSDTVLSEVLRAAEKLMNPQDEGARFMRAFWHKRGIKMGTQQAKGSAVFINRNFARNPETSPSPGDAVTQDEDDAFMGVKDDPKDLIITHNLTPENVMHAIRMGGIPVPSLAVTKKDNALSSFGSITLIGKKEMADPKGYAGTKVFGADIYSPRYPNVEYKIEGQALRSINEKLRPFLDGGREIYGGELSRLDDLISNKAFKRFAADKLGKPDQNAVGYHELKGVASALIAESGAEERIFRGYTNSGNRKYIPHTLDNVVAILKKELRGGENFSYGVGSVRAKYTPKFNSVKEIRKGRDRLVTKEEFDVIKKEVDDEFFKIGEELSVFHRASNSFGYSDAVALMMSDAAKMGIPRALEENGFEDVSAESMETVRDYLNKLRTLPTEYFEAKILRPVSLAEFAAAVVPERTNQAVIDAMRKEGIAKIVTYKDDAERKEVTRKVAEELGDDAVFMGEAESPVFYSALRREIDGLSTKSAPAVGWNMALQGLVKNGKVKADELEWTGISEWLKLQTGKVSKDDVLAFLDANGVQVTETVLGDEARETAAERWMQERARLEFAMPFDSLDEADQDYIRGKAEDANIAPDRLTKYSQYTLPGGENYREVLLTLPSKENVPVTYTVEQARSGDWVVKEDGKVVGNYGDDKALAESEAEDNRQRTKNGARELPKYRSSHWDQSNVLAHIRVNDRTDAQGRKTLFVEELQSDFQQDYRKSKAAIRNAVETDFQGIVDRMKRAGVLEVRCD